MSRAVNVSVMPVSRLVFDVCRVDGDTTSFLLRSFVDLVIASELGSTGLCENLGNSCGKSGFTMVDVACETVRCENMTGS